MVRFREFLRERNRRGVRVFDFFECRPPPVEGSGFGF